MSDIKVSDLQPIGFDLFADSESYMNDLSETELAVQGGVSSLVASSVPCAHGIAIGVAAVGAGIAYGLNWLLSDNSSGSGGYSVPDGSGGVYNVITYNGTTEVIYS